MSYGVRIVALLHLLAVEAVEIVSLIIELEMYLVLHDSEELSHTEEL